MPELPAGFVPGRWRCPIRAPLLLRSAALWLISSAVPFVEVVKGAGALAFEAGSTSGYRWPVVGLSRFWAFNRLLSPIIRFGCASVRATAPFLGGVARVLRPSSQRRCLLLVSRAARRSLKAPDSGSGNARRNACPRWSAACAGSIGARRAARSAEVGLSTIPSAPNHS